jgi:hypothetical protein
LSRTLRALDNRADEENSKIPEISDDVLIEVIEVLGQDITENNIQMLRDMIRMSAEVVETSKIKRATGSLTEHHIQILSPELSKKDFQGALLEGTIFKESLYGGFFEELSSIFNHRINTNQQ